MYKQISICILVLLIGPWSFSQVSVKDFGAVGDGKTDDTRAFEQAMRKAAGEGKYVQVPKGTYLLSRWSISSDVKGSPGSILKKKHNNKLEYYDFCKVEKQTDISIDGITFDGNVLLKSNSVIPSAGSIPLYILNSRNITIKNCKFMNSPMAGLRVENSNTVQVADCAAAFTRGNYGDGYYFANTTNGKVENCKASDFTRIGFVTENRSRDFVFSGCVAENGHSSSKSRGGIEYNGGFWYENSGNISTVNCTASNIKDRGFVAATGSKLFNILPKNIASFSFQNCTSNNIPQGFQVSSNANVSVSALLNNCIANGAVKGFICTPNHRSDRIKYESCTAVLNDLARQPLNSIGFMWGNKLKNAGALPVIEYNNCTVRYPSATDYNVLLNKNSNSGDISTYEGGAVTIKVNNLKNSFNKEAVIKSRKGTPKYQIENTHPHKTFFKGDQ
ncbi:MAG: right-handed parallel beta-helix repeat-containing protein [Taibaiella sp.]|nr:right-handed parallel beta-helix repeat-containing protein [Taibaiella sp.]